MSVNWNRFRHSAKTMIDKYGRNVTMLKAGALLDANKPLGGHQPATEVGGVKAVFVAPGSNQNLGYAKYMSPGLLERAEQIAIVLPSLIHDFRGFTGMRDDGSVWKIDTVDELKPGPVPLVLFIGVVR